MTSTETKAPANLRTTRKEQTQARKAPAKAPAKAAAKPAAEKQAA